MPFSPISRRTGAFAALLLLTSLLSCGREITGPNGGRFAGAIAFAPYLESAQPVEGAEALSIAGLVPFERVRIVITRDGTAVVSKVVEFEPTADSVALQVNVPLESGSTDGEPFEASLQYINAAGDTVFRGGPLGIIVRAGATANPTPIQMPLQHVGPGSQAVSVTVAPDSITAMSGQVASLTAVAYDAQQVVVPDAVIGFVSRNPAIAAVPQLGVGSVDLVGVRGSTWVLAQLINGAADSTKITIDPIPASLAIAGGDGQETLQGTPFAEPLKVRVLASDGLGVAGWPVDFVVTSGQGTLDSAVAQTDVNGYAQVTWTAGDSVGAASVTASVPAPALNVVFTGTQLSSGPVGTTFESQPANITAGESLPVIAVAVRNGAGEVVTSYAGPVTLALGGGTAGAALVGDTLQNAIAGAVEFGGLTVDRGGSGYFLVAKLTGTPPTPSSTFDVAAAPPATTTLVGGGGQSAPPATPLADSIKVRVTDQFGLPVAGVTVSFAVTQGGGDVSPTSGLTNSDGRAATRWTLGASGPQQITATAGPVAPLAIDAAVIGGGPVTLFAGYDYTYIPAGQTRTIPIFLSSPSASPVTVALSMTDTIAAWDVDSVVIPAGVTSVSVPVTASVPGQAWAFLASQVGNDSVFVFVDSASVGFAALDYSSFAVGDTVRTVVQLSDPAPAGGVTVTVRSLDPSIALVAPASGAGTPVPGCLSLSYCGGDLRAEGAEPVGTTDALLLAPPADSALVVIPEGGVIGQVAAVIVGNGGGGGVFTYFTASAPGHVGAQRDLYIVDATLFAYGSGASLTEPIGVGQQLSGYIYHDAGAVSQERRITLLSRSPAVATVDTLAVMRRLEYFTADFDVRGLSEGTATIVYSSPGAVTDSFTVTVAAPALGVQANTPVLAEGQSDYLYVNARAVGGVSAHPRATALPFTIRVSDPSVVEFGLAAGEIAAGQGTQQLPFRIVGPGSTYIVAEAAGHAPDSVLVSTTQTQPVLYSGPLSVGVGQYQEVGIILPSSQVYGVTQAVDVTSLDPGTVRVLTPTLQFSFESTIAELAVAGLVAGSGTVRLTGAGLLPLDLVVTVGAPALTLGGSTLTLDPDSVPRTIVGYTGDGTYSHPSMDTVVAILRSSDPSVVEVTDSTLVFAAGSDVSTDGQYRAVRAGAAQLTLHAPGHDSSNAVAITVSPYRLLATSGSVLVGHRLREYASLFRNSPTGDSLAYAVSQQGPGTVSLVQLPASFPAGTGLLNYQLAGVTVGADTIVFSAAGHEPDTLIVVVDSARLEMGQTYSEVIAGFIDDAVFPYLRIGESSLMRRLDVPMRFVVRSLDTTLARVEQDTVRFEPDDVYPSQYATVRYVDQGYVNLVAEDADGILAPDTVEVYISPRELYGYTSYADDAIVLGMGQRTAEYEVAVSRIYASSEPLWVHLKTSAPGIVSLPDSVLIGEFYSDANVTLVALDSVGSVRVEASAPGYNVWQFDVVVTRTVAGLYLDNTYVGGRTTADVYLMDALTGYARPMAASVPMQMVSERPSVADAGAGAFTYPADSAYLTIPGPVGVSVGAATVAVEDTRTGVFDLVARGAADVEVYEPAIVLYKERYQTGPGLTSSTAQQSFGVSALRDSIWVRIASVGGRFAPSADSLLVTRISGGGNAFPASTLFESFALTGLTPGIDTLVVSADGLRADTAIVSVEPGILEILDVSAPTIVVGDSARVELYFTDGSGAPAMTASSVLLSFATDTAFAVSDGTTVVGSINVSPGTSGVAFWVKALGQGTSELTITSASFRTLRLSLTTRPLP